MEILFIGDAVTGYFAAEWAKSRKCTYGQIDSHAHIKQTTGDILAYVGYGQHPVDVLIYDVEGFIDPAEMIAAEIAGVAKTLSAKPVVYMPSFQPGSALCQALFAKDVKSYIFAGSAAYLKEQLAKNIGGYFEANERAEVEEIQQIQEEASTRHENFRSIGVAGSQSRIGVTTQAIQIVKYLQYLGYKACYIQLNQTAYFDASPKSGKYRSLSYVEKCAAWYEERKGPAVVYGGVDLYAGQDALAEAIETYDYYVYDYGVVFDRDFDRTAYLKDDVKILVGGGKVQEFDAIERILTLPAYTSCSVILSFMPQGEEDRADALRLLTEAGGSRLIAFAGFTPDPFVFTDAAMFERLLPLQPAEADDETEEVEKQKKKRGFFRRKKVKA